MSRFTDTRAWKTTLAYPGDIDKKIKEHLHLTPEEREQVKQTDQFNAIRMIVPRIAADDLRFNWIRVVTLSLISLITVGGTIVLFVAVNGGDLAGSIAGGSVVVVTLAYAGLANPLQTVERDEVFRRWSDMIVSTFILGISDTRPVPGAVEAAATNASNRFATLAKSYAAIVARSNKTFEALGGDTGSVSPPAATAPTTLSIVNPGSQTGKAGSQLSPDLTVAGSGPGTLHYSAIGLPGSLAIDDATGIIAGQLPAAAANSTVSVKVTSDALNGQSASATFGWTVSAS